MPVHPDPLRLIRSLRRPPRLAGWARYLDGAAFDGAARTSANAELVYLERGRMRWRTAGIEWDIRAPALVLARPGEAERRRFIGTCRHAFIHISPDHRSLRLWQGLPPIPPLAIAMDSPVPAVVRHLVDLVMDGDSGGGAVALAACHLLVATALAGRSRDASRAIDELPTPVRRALLWLQQDWRTHGVRLRRLDELAAAAGCSPRHCGRLFRTHLGMQPVAAVQLLRAGLAQILLQRTGASVKEVAARLGFRHANHLSQLLATSFGLGPMAMREAWRAGRPVPMLTCPPLREILNVLDT